MYYKVSAKITCGSIRIPRLHGVFWAKKGTKIIDIKNQCTEWLMRNTAEVLTKEGRIKPEDVDKIEVSLSLKKQQEDFLIKDKNFNK